jgi:hypothetical protein
MKRDKPGQLHTETLTLLKQRSKRLLLTHVSEDTGLPYKWLWMFEHERIDDPSVNRIEILRNYLLTKCA